MTLDTTARIEVDASPLINAFNLIANSSETVEQAFRGLAAYMKDVSDVARTLDANGKAMATTFKGVTREGQAFTATLGTLTETLEDGTSRVVIGVKGLKLAGSDIAGATAQISGSMAQLRDAVGIDPTSKLATAFGAVAPAIDKYQKDLKELGNVTVALTGKSNTFKTVLEGVTAGNRATSISLTTSWNDQSKTYDTLVDKIKTGTKTLDEVEDARAAKNVARATKEKTLAQQRASQADKDLADIRRNLQAQGMITNASGVRSIGTGNDQAYVDKLQSRFNDLHSKFVKYMDEIRTGAISQAQLMEMAAGTDKMFTGAAGDLQKSVIAVRSITQEVKDAANAQLDHNNKLAQARGLYKTIQGELTKSGNIAKATDINIQNLGGIDKDKALQAQKVFKAASRELFDVLVKNGVELSKQPNLLQEIGKMLTTNGTVYVGMLGSLQKVIDKHKDLTRGVHENITGAKEHTAAIAQAASIVDNIRLNYGTLMPQAADKGFTSVEKRLAGVQDHIVKNKITAQQFNDVFRDIGLDGITYADAQLNKLRTQLLGLHDDVSAVTSRKLAAGFKGQAQEIIKVIKADVSQGLATASPKDQADFLGMLKSLDDLSAKAKLSAQEINAMWAKVRAGDITDVDALHSSVLKKMLAIDALSDKMRNSGQGASGASALAAEYVTGAMGQGSTRFKVATTELQAAYVKVTNDVINYARKHNISANEVQDQISKVRKGVYELGGQYNDLILKIKKVEEAHQALNDTGKKGLITWAQLARFFEARVLYEVFAVMRTELSKGVQSAIELEQVIGRITTLTKDTSSINQWADSIKRVSDSFGLKEIDVANSYYEALSNQIADTVTEVEQFTRSTAEFALTTGSTADQAQKLFSSVVNSFNRSAIESEVIAGELFKAIDLGRITAGELADSYGRTAVAANTLGITNAELAGSLAHLSIQGVKTSDAQTQMLNLMNKMIKPTEHMQKLFRSWGYESGEAAIQGLKWTGVLQKMSDLLAEKGIAEAGKQVSDLRALRAELGLAADDNFLKTFNTIQQIKDSYGEYAEATEKVMKTNGQIVAIELNKVRNYFIALGRDIIDVGAKMNGLSSYLETIAALLGGALTGAAVYFVSTGLLPMAAATLKVVTSMTAAKLAVNALTASMIKSPLGAVAVALAAIAGTVATAWMYSAARTEEALTRMNDAAAKSLEDSNKLLGRHISRVRDLFKDQTALATSKIADGSAVAEAILRDAESKLKSLLPGLDYLEKAATKTIEMKLQSIKNVLNGIEDAMKRAAGMAEDMQSKIESAAIDEADAKLTPFERRAKYADEQLKAMREANELMERGDANSVAAANQATERAKMYGEKMVQAEKDRRAELEKTQKSVKTNEEEATKADEGLMESKQAVHNAALNLAKAEMALQNANITATGRKYKKNTDKDDKAANRQQTSNINLEQAQDRYKQAMAEYEKQLNETKGKHADVATSMASLQQQVWVDATKFMQDHYKALETTNKTFADTSKRLSDKVRKDELQAEIEAEVRKTEIKQSFDLIRNAKNRKFLEERYDEGTLGNVEKDVRDAMANIQRLTSLGDNEFDAIFKNVFDVTNAQEYVDNVEMAAKSVGDQKTAAKEIRDLGEAEARRVEDMTKASQDLLAAEAERLRIHKELLEVTTNLSNSEGFNEQTGTFGETNENRLRGRILGQGTFNQKDLQDLRSLLIDKAGKARTVDEVDQLSKYVDLTRQLEQAGPAVENLREQLMELGGNDPARKVGELKDEFQILMDKIGGWTNTLKDINSKAAPTVNKASGGSIYSTDSVRAMLSPGEYVMSQAASRKYGGILSSLNSGQASSNGGTVVGDININYQGTGNSSADAVGIGREIKRQIRHGRFSFS